MKKHFLTFATMALLTACGGGTNNNNTTTDSTTQEVTTTAPAPSSSALEPDFPDWQNRFARPPYARVGDEYDSQSRCDGEARPYRQEVGRRVQHLNAQPALERTASS